MSAGVTITTDLKATGVGLHPETAAFFIYG